MIELNLLPLERKRYIAQQRRNRLATAVSTGVVVIVLLGTAVIFGANIYIGSLVDSNKAKVEQTKDDLKRYADIEQAVLSIRDRVAALATKEKDRLIWSDISEDLANAVPEGVQLTQAALSTTSLPHLQMSGKAENKEKVAALRERMDFSDRFEEVVIRQTGEAEDESGTRTLTTFSIEANITGVMPPKPAAKPAGVGE